MNQLFTKEWHQRYWKSTHDRSVRIGPDLGQMAPNKTNVGFFKISFSAFWLGEPKCTETDLKKSQICQFRTNLTQFGCQFDIYSSNPARNPLEVLEIFVCLFSYCFVVISCFSKGVKKVNSYCSYLTVRSGNDKKCWCLPVRTGHTQVILVLSKVWYINDLNGALSVIHYSL